MAVRWALPSETRRERRGMKGRDARNKAGEAIEIRRRNDRGRRKNHIMIFPPNTPQKTHVSLLLSCRPAHSGYTRQPHLVLRRRAQVPSMHATMRSLANRNKSTSRDCESEKQRRTRQTNGPGEKNDTPPRQTAPSGQTRHFAQHNRSAISGLPWGPRSPRVGPYYRHIPIQVNTRVAQVAPGRKIFPTLVLCGKYEGRPGHPG